jgi:hypothetical protein
VSYVYGKAVIAHVVSSKEDCLAKLLHYDFVVENLPVGLGGSWTGGCEPWRRQRGNDSSAGSEELTLEIETDLSCLFRNVLWFHEQVVVAANRSTQTAAMAAANNEPQLEDEDDRTKPVVVAVKQRDPASELSDDEDRKPAAKPYKRIYSVETSASPGNPCERKRRHYGAAVAKGPNPEQQQQQQQLTLEELEEDKTLRPWRYETEEQKKKRRERDVGYAKKKREKEKIIVQVLQREYHDLAKVNRTLKEEGERLQRFLQAAEHEIVMEH